ncbi:Os06g0631550 [Oryza sativa Japonica Group]|uniref:Uncharacterized protein n=2 Tax=Oryza sativa subsp. japonica TaxID=39947 RepID=A0A0P0WYY8_ORYSJ|nr:hypothetical protein DAI22_06g222800 [Oryza sativa Japonica Group]BAD38591.1 hypothetical protein [Oryza sativa Japonica Group]BAS98732.1 Os06g0631550 [Oryza sativa Japonica Group]
MMQSMVRSAARHAVYVLRRFGCVCESRAAAGRSLSNVRAGEPPAALREEKKKKRLFSFRMTEEERSRVFHASVIWGVVFGQIVIFTMHKPRSCKEIMAELEAKAAVSRQNSPN